MRIYKYLPKRFAEPFARQGAIKIGTLYEYRDTERYNAAVADQDEGASHTKLELQGGGEVDLSKQSPEADFFRKYILTPEQQHVGLRMVLGDGARLIVSSNSEDLYVFCASTVFSLTTMAEFESDACIEISNALSFVKALSHTIRHKARLLACAEVKYLARTTDYTAPHQLHPAVMKDPQYEYQREWRALWQPIKPINGSLFVESPRAAAYCSRYVP